MLRLASESHVRMIIVAQVESLVALMENALRLVLGRRAMAPQIVQQVNIVVIALTVQVNVPLLVLENRAKYESHCATREYCCGNAPSYLRKCAKSCIGISCTYNSECASGESCSSNKKCVLSWRRKHCIFEKDCAQGESCHSRLCVQICTNRKQCGLNEFCCSFQEIFGMCRTSCLGISCQSDQDCASGEHCSGTYNKVCSRTHTAQACYTNGDCSTGQCCDDDRNCTTGECDSKKIYRWN